MLNLKKVNFKLVGIVASIVVVIGLVMRIVPIVKKQIVLNGINKQIRVYEKSKNVLSGEISQLGLDWKKCEDLQNTVSEQAQGKRGEIADIENEIAKLKNNYNEIAGFTSRL